ncbi:MAG: LapA family protein [Proteobacteria bacterium]|nr:LapA family protein [Desulfobacula sp.]MBU3953659.1 LapA family protein [Pseudomonadota bacterium]MBU4129535.1 LapA family protein [Pseudomonadota bacterium]
MKAIKTLFLLIVLGLLGTLVYQNLDYFMTPSALNIDLKVSTWHWTAPSLPNIAYWGICFGLGLLVTGVKGLFTAFRLGREIKAQEGLISKMKQEINDLKIRLDVFVHDPYIKQELKTIAGGEAVDKNVSSDL